MGSPLITVIIATYNASATLQRCLDSFASQNYLHKELIVIDGGSEDATVNILKENSNVITCWESEKDRGIYHAWNKALGKAKGDWICFLGADDFFWERNVLERIGEQTSKIPPEIMVIYGNVAVIDDESRVLYMIENPWCEVKHLLLEQMPIPHPGLMHSREIFKLHGLFDEKFRIAADYELLLRVLKSEDAYYLPGCIVAGMRYGGVSSNLNDMPKILLEEARARRKNNLKVVSLRWIKRFIRACARKTLAKLLGEKRLRRLAIVRGQIVGSPSFWEKVRD